MLNDFFTINDCLQDDDSFLSRNSVDDPLTQIDCNYTSAAEFKSFPKNNITYNFSTFSLNMRSLCNSKNLDNLKCVRKSMNSYPTTIGITETWLQENSLDPCTDLPNYAFFLKCRSKSKGGGGGGGVGLYACKNSTYWLHDDISTFEEGCFKSVFVEIKLDKFNIICSNVYKPPFTDTD